MDAVSWKTFFMPCFILRAAYRVAIFCCIIQFSPLVEGMTAQQVLLVR